MDSARVVGVPNTLTIDSSSCHRGHLEHICLWYASVRMWWEFRHLTSGILNHIVTDKGSHLELHVQILGPALVRQTSTTRDVGGWDGYYRVDVSHRRDAVGTRW